MPYNTFRMVDTVLNMLKYEEHTGAMNHMIMTTLFKDQIGNNGTFELMIDNLADVE